MFTNLRKLVLKIEIDLGREPKILSKFLRIRIFRDFSDSEVF